MAITLTSNGYIINSGSEVTSKAAKLNTYKSGENGSRQNIPNHSGSGTTIMWEALTNFTKKTSTSTIVIEGSCIGMDDYSHPYGGTSITLTHSDGTVYEKYVGTAYTSNSGGNHAIIWWMCAYFTGSDLGNKTGDFDVKWGYGRYDNGGGPDKPWETYWNWDSNDDSRAYPQGSHTAVYELES